MGKDTVISYGKVIVCMMAHSNRPILDMVRSRIGASWRGLTAIDVNIFTHIETRARFPRTYSVGWSICRIRAVALISTYRPINNIRPFAVRQCRAGAPTSIRLRLRTFLRDNRLGSSCVTVSFKSCVADMTRSGGAASLVSLPL